MKVLNPSLDARGLRVALVVSRFNHLISIRLIDGARDVLYAHGLDILDAKQKTTSRRLCVVPGDQRRIGVAQMHIAARRGRESHGLPRAYRREDGVGRGGIIIDGDGHVL